MPRSREHSIIRKPRGDRSDALHADFNDRLRVDENVRCFQLQTRQTPLNLPHKDQSASRMRGELI
jgi:hypothetical protein